ncbi:hypothetical protein DAETH_44270 (plasmid) [Deinococcus aetherius]|uniref:Uncharacterized protein n=2 Tax=Deinococcus aetherius TaxID=200252 RepID=A0ABN6RMA6_9DEIO|nr:hypothetical protein DAETH_44270 [Deinococcus aetherius]
MRAPRYFVLVVDGLPLTQQDNPDVPVVFREEREALAAGHALQGGDSPKTVVLEAYADDYSFVGSRHLESPSGLTLQSASQQ